MLVAHGFGEQAGLGRGADVGRPDQLEIAVRRHGVAGQRRQVARLARLVDGNCVVGTLDRGQREAGVDGHAEPDRVDLAHGGVEHGGDDPLGVGHSVGASRPARRAQADGLDRAGNEARAHHHGEAQPEAAVVVDQHLLILDLDGDLLAGPDVGDRRGEDVRPLALQQTGLLAFLLRRLVNPAGFLALLDAALDDAVADAHPEVVHRRVLGQGKDVHPFDPVVARIEEGLHHMGAGDQAAHGDLDLGSDHGRIEQRCAFAALEQQAAAAHIVELHDGGHGGGHGARPGGGLGGRRRCRPGGGGQHENQ